MPYTVSSNEILQTGTETSLSGLQSLSGVTVLDNGKQKQYVLGTKRLKINGTLNINPEIECLVTNCSKAIWCTSGTLNINGLISSTGATTKIYSKNYFAISLKNTVTSPTDYDEAFFAIRSKATINWKGGYIFGEQGIYFDSYSTHYPNINIEYGGVNFLGQDLAIVFNGKNFNIKKFKLINGGMIILSRLQPSDNNWFKNLETNNAKGALCFRPSYNTFAFVINYISNNSIVDYQYWREGKVKYINPKNGSNLITEGYLVNQSHNKGLLEVIKEVNFSVIDQKLETDIPDTKIYCKDTNNNSRVNFLNENYTNDKTYNFSMNTTQQILVAVHYRKDTSGSMSDPTKNLVDYRGNENNSTDKFTFQFCDYNYNIEKRTLILKDINVLNYTMRLLYDKNVTEKNKQTVLGYLTTKGQLKNANEVYDVAKHYLYANWGITNNFTELFVKKEGVFLDFDTYNVEISNINSSLFYFDDSSNTIKIKSSELTANIKTVGTVVIDASSELKGSCTIAGVRKNKIKFLNLNETSIYIQDENNTYIDSYSKHNTTLNIDLDDINKDYNILLSKAGCKKEYYTIKKETHYTEINAKNEELKNNNKSNMFTNINNNNIIFSTADSNNKIIANLDGTINGQNFFNELEKYLTTTDGMDWFIKNNFQQPKLYIFSKKEFLILPNNIFVNYDSSSNINNNYITAYILTKEGANFNTSSIKKTIYNEILSTLDLSILESKIKNIHIQTSNIDAIKLQTDNIPSIGKQLALTSKFLITKNHKKIENFLITHSNFVAGNYLIANGIIDANDKLTFDSTNNTIKLNFNLLPSQHYDKIIFEDFQLTDGEMDDFEIEVELTHGPKDKRTVLIHKHGSATLSAQTEPLKNLFLSIEPYKLFTQSHQFTKLTLTLRSSGNRSAKLKLRIVSSYEMASHEKTGLRPLKSNIVQVAGMTVDSINKFKADDSKFTAIKSETDKIQFVKEQLGLTSEFLLTEGYKQINKITITKAHSNDGTYTLADGAIDTFDQLSFNPITKTIKLSFPLTQTTHYDKIVFENFQLKSGEMDDFEIEVELTHGTSDKRTVLFHKYVSGKLLATNEPLKDFVLSVEPYKLFAQSNQFTKLDLILRSSGDSAARLKLSAVSHYELAHHEKTELRPIKSNIVQVAGMTVDSINKFKADDSKFTDIKSQTDKIPFLKEQLRLTSESLLTEDHKQLNKITITKAHSNDGTYTLADGAIDTFDQLSFNPITKTIKLSFQLIQTTHYDKIVFENFQLKSGQMDNFEIEVELTHGTSDKRTVLLHKYPSGTLLSTDEALKDFVLSVEPYKLFAQSNQFTKLDLTLRSSGDRSARLKLNAVSPYEIALHEKTGLRPLKSNIVQVAGMTVDSIDKFKADDSKFTAIKSETDKIQFVKEQLRLTSESLLTEDHKQLNKIMITQTHSHDGTYTLADGAIDTFDQLSFNPLTKTIKLSFPLTQTTHYDKIVFENFQLKSGEMDDFEIEVELTHGTSDKRTVFLHKSPSGTLLPTNEALKDFVFSVEPYKLFAQSNQFTKLDLILRSSGDSAARLKLSAVSYYEIALHEKTGLRPLKSNIVQVAGVTVDSINKFKADDSKFTAIKNETDKIQFVKEQLGLTSKSLLTEDHKQLNKITITQAHSTDGTYTIGHGSIDANDKLTFDSTNKTIKLSFPLIQTIHYEKIVFEDFQLTDGEIDDFEIKVELTHGTTDKRTVFLHKYASGTLLATNEPLKYFVFSIEPYKLFARSDQFTKLDLTLRCAVTRSAKLKLRAVSHYESCPLKSNIVQVAGVTVDSINKFKADDSKFTAIKNETDKIQFVKEQLGLTSKSLLTEDHKQLNKITITQAHSTDGTYTIEHGSIDANDKLTFDSTNKTIKLSFPLIQTIHYEKIVFEDFQLTDGEIDDFEIKVELTHGTTDKRTVFLHKYASGTLLATDEPLKDFVFLIEPYKLFARSDQFTKLDLTLRCAVTRSAKLKLSAVAHYESCPIKSNIVQVAGVAINSINDLKAGTIDLSSLDSKFQAIQDETDKLDSVKQQLYINKEFLVTKNHKKTKNFAITNTNKNTAFTFQTPNGSGTIDNTDKLSFDSINNIIHLDISLQGAPVHDKIIFKDFELTDGTINDLRMEVIMTNQINNTIIKKTVLNLLYDSGTILSTKNNLSNFIIAIEPYQIFGTRKGFTEIQLKLTCTNNSSAKLKINNISYYEKDYSKFENIDNEIKKIQDKTDKIDFIKSKTDQMQFENDYIKSTSNPKSNTSFKHIDFTSTNLNSDFSILNANISKKFVLTTTDVLNLKKSISIMLNNESSYLSGKNIKKIILKEFKIVGSQSDFLDDSNMPEPLELELKIQTHKTTFVRTQKWKKNQIPLIKTDLNFLIDNNLGENINDITIKIIAQTININTSISFHIQKIEFFEDYIFHKDFDLQKIKKETDKIASIQAKTNLMNFDSSNRIESNTIFSSSSLNLSSLDPKFEEIKMETDKIQTMKNVVATKTETDNLKTRLKTIQSQLGVTTNYNQTKDHQIIKNFKIQNANINTDFTLENGSIDINNHLSFTNALSPYKILLKFPLDTNLHYDKIVFKDFQLTSGTITDLKIKTEINHNISGKIITDDLKYGSQKSYYTEDPLNGIVISIEPYKFFNFTNNLTFITLELSCFSNALAKLKINSVAYYKMSSRKNLDDLTRKFDEIKIQTNNISSIKSQTDHIPNIKLQTDKISSIETNVTNVKTETDKIPTTITSLDSIKTETDKMPGMITNVTDIKTESDKIPSLVTNLGNVKIETDKIPAVKTDTANIKLATNTLSAIGAEVNKIQGIETQTNKLTNIEIQANKLINVENQANKIPNIKNATDEIINVKAQTDKIPGIETQTNKMTNIEIQANKIPGMESQTNKLTNIQNQTNKLTTIETQSNKLTNIETQANQVPNITTQVNKIPDIKSKTDRITFTKNNNIHAVTSVQLSTVDLSNIDTKFEEIKKETDKIPNVITETNKIPSIVTKTAEIETHIDTGIINSNIISVGGVGVTSPADIGSGGNKFIEIEKELETISEDIKITKDHAKAADIQTQKKDA